MSEPAQVRSVVEDRSAKHPSRNQLKSVPDLGGSVRAECAIGSLNITGWHSSSSIRWVRALQQREGVSAVLPWQSPEARRTPVQLESSCELVGSSFVDFSPAKVNPPVLTWSTFFFYLVSEI